MSVLKEICNKKRAHVAEQKKRASLDVLKEQIAAQDKPRGFIENLKNTPFPAVVAEVKKASPSKGVIRQDFDPIAIAESYKKAGAACLSVLTDAPYFQGSDEIFASVRANSSLPMLRKDFMVDEYQIYESRAMGADCVLLIMAELSDAQAAEFYALALDLGMDVLVEVHDAQELERAKLFSPQMIGVNNRNLKTLDVNVQTSIQLAQDMPENTVRIAESGLGSFDVLQDLQSAGYQGFLVGESLMRQDDIELALRTLRGQ